MLAAAAQDPARTPGAARRLPWRPVLGVALLLVLCFVAAASCQRAQVRLDATQALATARGEVGFRPEDEQIRLVRQGLTSRPYWAVSLSVPGERGGDLEHLAVVKIDANTGRVASVATR